MFQLSRKPTFGQKGKFFGTSAEKSVQTHFYTGDKSYNTPFDTNVTISTALSDAVTVPFAPNAGNTVFNHFYTFGNDGTTQPTILAIKSTKTVNSTPSTIYYPVHFTTADAGHTIEPGKSYTVTVHRRDCDCCSMGSRNCQQRV